MATPRWVLARRRGAGFSPNTWSSIAAAGALFAANPTDVRLADMGQPVQAGGCAHRQPLVPAHRAAPPAVPPRTARPQVHSGRVNLPGGQQFKRPTWLFRSRIEQSEMPFAGHTHRPAAKPRDRSRLAPASARQPPTGLAAAALRTTPSCQLQLRRISLDGNRPEPISDPGLPISVPCGRRPPHPLNLGRGRGSAANKSSTEHPNARASVKAAVTDGLSRPASIALMPVRDRPARAASSCCDQP